MSIAHDARSARAEGDEPNAAAVRALLDRDPPAMIVKSIAAFRRDLHELLRTQRGRWVAITATGGSGSGAGRRRCTRSACDRG